MEGVKWTRDLQQSAPFVTRAFGANAAPPRSDGSCVFCSRVSEVPFICVNVKQACVKTERVLSDCLYKIEAAKRCKVIQKVELGKQND